MPRSIIPIKLYKMRMRINARLHNVVFDRLRLADDDDARYIVGIKTKTGC